MPAQFLRDAADKFTDAMHSAERFSVGMSARAKRLKQAMFPQEQPPEATKAPRDDAAAQDDLDRKDLKREMRTRR